MRGVLAKKGSFREDVPYLIISIIGLVFIIYAGWKLYHLNIDPEEKVAKERLELLVEKIEKIEDGKKVLLQGFKSKSAWYLVGWSKIEGDKEGKPDKCFGSSCLCICKGVPNLKPDLRNACQENGFCENLDFEYIFVWQGNGPSFASPDEDAPLDALDICNLDNSQCEQYLKIPDNLVELKFLKNSEYDYIWMYDTK